GGGGGGRRPGGPWPRRPDRSRHRGMRLGPGPDRGGAAAVRAMGAAVVPRGTRRSRRAGALAATGGGETRVGLVGEHSERCSTSRRGDGNPRWRGVLPVLAGRPAPLLPCRDFP